jgi:hypothetical protein
MQPCHPSTMVLFDMFVLFDYFSPMKRKSKNTEISTSEPVSDKTPAKGKSALNLPPPEFLLELAESEQDQGLLDDYHKVITTLRAKNFTFREIAEWLAKRGLEVDHNAVYRTFCKHATDQEIEDDAIKDAEYEASQPAVISPRKTRT